MVGGGEGGIRTRDALPRTVLPVRHHSPLGDLSGRERVAAWAWSDGHPGIVGRGAWPSSRGTERRYLFTVWSGDGSPRLPALDRLHVSWHGKVTTSDT